MKLLPFDYAVRNTGRSPVKALLTIAGTAIVVTLVFVLSTFTDAVSSTVKQSGDPRNMILMGTGSENYVEQSEISMSSPTEITAGADGIHQLPYSDAYMISPEIHHSTFVSLTQEQGDKSAFLRGITDTAYYVHDNVRLTTGSLPQSGEILVGKLVAAKLGVKADDLKIGQSLRMENQDWKISGFFEAPGTVLESEIWIPLQELIIATKRDTLSCVIARVPDPDDQTNLDIFTKTRLDLELSAINETEYYSSLAAFYKPIRIMSIIMTVMIITVGVFGGANTITATIASRTKEMACLQTIGYSRRAILVSVMQETFLLIAAGYIIAVLFAFIALNGQSLRFSMSAFSMDITSSVLFFGLSAGIAIWIFGTIIPAATLFQSKLTDQLRV